MRNIKRNLTSLLLITVLCVSPIGVHAASMDGGSGGNGEMVLPTQTDNIISVVLPTVGEDSPYDFFLDPDSLIFQTGAAKYGGGRVEENAHLLFHNRKNDTYDYSRISDSLNIVNKSTVPVSVTISARMTDLGGVGMSDSADLSGYTDPTMYMALIDNEGNLQPIPSDGEVSIYAELEKAPSGVYTWIYDSETDSYRYQINDDSGVIYDSYSFGLTGDCSVGDAWRNVNIYPKVEITWHVEPITNASPAVTEEAPVNDYVEETPAEPVEEYHEEVVD